MMDWMQLPAEQKQRLLGTAAYGQLSARINRLLYVPAYLHLALWFYSIKTG